MLSQVSDQPDQLGEVQPAAPAGFPAWAYAVITVVVLAVIGTAVLVRGPSHHEADRLQTRAQLGGVADPTADPTAAAVTATPEPTPAPSVTVKPARVGPGPGPSAVAATRSPQPTNKPVSEADEHARYCRTASKTTGPITLMLEVCAWPGDANDSYTTTMTFGPDLVYRGIEVDQGDGTKRVQPHNYWTCAKGDQPRTLYDGENIHEFAVGTTTITATVTAHRCGDPNPAPSATPDPGYEDTDSPVTASVSLQLVKRPGT